MPLQIIWILLLFRIASVRCFQSRHNATTNYGVYEFTEYMSSLICIHCICPMFSVMALLETSSGFLPLLLAYMHGPVPASPATTLEHRPHRTTRVPFHFVIPRRWN